MERFGSTINLLTFLEANEYKNYNFHKSGVAAGNIEKILIGAPELGSPVCEPPQRDQSHDVKETAVQFAAGYYWGIV